MTNKRITKLPKAKKNVREKVASTNAAPPSQIADRDVAIRATTGGIRAVVRTCAIIRLISEGGVDGVSLIDLAKTVDLPKSSTHRYVQALEGEGFVERDAQTSKYRLGIGFVSLQASHVERLLQRTRPILAKIRDNFDETVNIGMLMGGQVVYLDILESTRSMRLAARKGDTESIHATALGKAIVATLLDVEVLKLLRQSGMTQLTEHTITTEGEYLHELERIRFAGYAVDDCENELEGRCVAVFVPGLPIPTAISVSGVASRFSMDNAHVVANSLRIAAMEISGENLPPFKRLQMRSVG